MKYKDYYAALGLERGASEEEIKRAYRRLARKYHPDVSKEPDAEERFKAVAEAYQTLKDADKRAAYDQLGQHAAGQEFKPSSDWQQHWQQQFGEGQQGETIDLSDLFAHLHARAGARPGARGEAPLDMPGEDFELSAAITVEQAYRGTELDLQLAIPEYDAHGHLRRVPRAFRARIPKGATEGQRLRLAGQGGKGFGGGRPGDLYLDIHLQPHLYYRVDGHDLFLDLPVTPSEAVLGASVEVPTPGGRVRLKVPAGAQAGQRLRLPGRGLPRPKGDPGDEYAIVQIVVPEPIDEAQRELYRQLAALSTVNPRARWEGSSHAS